MDFGFTSFWIVASHIIGSIASIVGFFPNTYSWIFFFLCILPIVLFIGWILGASSYKRKMQQETELIFSALGEGVVFLNADEKIEYANYTAIRFLGLSKILTARKTLAQIKDLGLSKKIQELLLFCKKRQTPLSDSLVIGEDNKVHLDVIMMPKPSHKGYILIVQDTSSHHKILEVGKDFVASASHELKTPITIIRGFAETLQDMKDLPKEIVEDILEKIVRNCHRMDSLVKSLLTLADIESLPLGNTQYCDIESLIEECRRIALSVYPEATIVITSPLQGISAEVDPSLLELAILNLLGNSIKYSANKAEVMVSLQQTPDELQIAIQDRGIGISSTDLEHIFDRFYTVNKAHSRKLGGAGLGLSLVKTIIEKHSGSIHVSSILGEGSTFVVSLPNHQ